MPPLTVSEAARLLGVTPRSISDLLYNRGLPDGDFPITGGRRLIPRDQIDNIRDALKRAGTRVGREVTNAR